MTCEPCSGKGWVFDAKKQPVYCGFCLGHAEISWGFVARKLGEHPSTLARVRQMRSKEKVCLRVLDKVSNLLWPKLPKQPEMFT